MADEFCKDREPPPKRQRLDEVGTPVIKQSASSPESTGSSIPVGTSISPESEAAEGAPIKYGLPPLQEFTVDQVLFNSAKTKSVALTGQFTSRPTLRAVIVAEKQPLTESDLQTILSSSTSLSQSFQNDIYAQYIASCSGGVGALKVQTVYPAEDAHIRKYAAQPFHLVHESPGDYETITRPFIEREVLGLEWVYNILEGRAEADRVIHSDPDPSTGFILLPDMKWDQTETESLYMLAIVRKRGLACMRDLSTEHLPLLKNVLEAGKRAINERYDLPLDQIRAYLHYPPSYYHLHIHFTHLKYDAPKTTVGQSHLLEDVIDNIENVDGSYYALRTIPCVVKEGDPLWEQFRRRREQTNGDCP